MQQIVLGGENARFQRVHGDIVASYQYVEGERAMVLWPLHRQKATAFVVCDSSAWKYDDPAYLARQAKLCCDLWGEAEGTRRWYDVAKVIHEGLSDLVRLPPEPVIRQAGDRIGEVTLSCDGRVLAAGEVDVPKGGV